MAVKKLGISPDLVIHPGETISDVLEEHGLTQKELARRAGVSEAFLSDVIHGKKDISKSLAMGLEYALGVPASFWLNLQANYDAELLALHEEGSIRAEEVTVLVRIRDIVKYLQKKEVLAGDMTREQTILRLRRYFRLSSLCDLGKLAPAGAFRLSDKAAVDPAVLGAWLCMCRSGSRNGSIKNGFDVSGIDTLVNGIKDIMCSVKGDPREKLTSLFAVHGIDFSVVHDFKGAPVHGYIALNGDGTYRMVLTLRGAFADIFWFSLFHELGHIVNGDLNRPGCFIDGAGPDNDGRESAADQFACRALLDPASYRRFLDKNNFTYSSIEAYSRDQNVPPYIVIGRLQNDEYISWDRFSRYKPRYRWAEG